MKLSTMLLPTGEFVLVLSEAPSCEAHWAREFKERSGATAMLVTTEPVEVEDALYDKDARRADTLGPEWEDIGYLDEAKDFIADYAAESRHFTDEPGWYSELRVPRAKMPGSDQVFSLSFTADGDSQLLDAFFGGKDFSPAGLVVDGEKTTVSDFDLTGPSSTPQVHEIDVKDVVVDSPEIEDPFVPGTRVEIIGPCWRDTFDVKGQTGTIEFNTYENTPDGCVLVTDLTDPEGECGDDDGVLHRFVPYSSLQIVPVELDWGNIVRSVN